MQKRNKKFVRKSKAERQREIVDAAIQLLGKHGVEGTTVSRIAAAAGIARGALYQHFPNREAVLEAAVDVMGERSSRWILESSGRDIPARLLNIGENHSSWSLSEYNTFVRPFFQLLAADPGTSLARHILQRHDLDFGYFVQLADEGKHQGSITNEVDSGDIAWCLLLHAWGEDIARLMGVEQFITEGASGRILQRLLATYSTGASSPATGEDGDS